MKIEKVKRCKRGYGSMTAALYKTKKSPRNCNGWDYVEVAYPTDSDYQRDVRALSDEDAQKLINKKIFEIPALGFQILGGVGQKWHTPKISPEGEIISLIC